MVSRTIQHLECVEVNDNKDCLFVLHIVVYCVCIRGLVDVYYSRDGSDHSRPCQLLKRDFHL